MKKLELPLLKESLLEAKVLQKGEYKYFIHPLTDTIPPLDPALLEEVCEGILKIVDGNFDLIVTMEAMGIHIAALLSQKTNVPFNVVRKRQYHLEKEHVLDQSTGYSKGSMYLNAVKKGDRVLVVDSVISTGGTLTAVLNCLKEVGANIKDVVCVIEKGDGVIKVKQETGYDVKTLVKINVTEDKVELMD